MKNKNKRLEKTLIKNFCVFSVIVIIIFVIVSRFMNFINNSVVSDVLEKRYDIQCEGVEDYDTVDAESLKEAGGWFEILDIQYQEIYPKENGRVYTGTEIVDIVNGNYEREGKTYQGKIKHFTDSKGKTRIQIIFFPSEVIDITTTVNIPYQISALPFGGIIIVGVLLFGFGYFVTVLIVSKKIRKNLSRPMDELRLAMKDLEKGNYKKRLELQAEYEFVEMGHSFNCMAEAMEEAVQKRQKEEMLRRQLISDLSHDIRTPLTIIQGYLTTVLNLAGQEESRLYLERCYESSQELKRLLDQLSDYNRMLRMDYRLREEKVDLTEFIKNILIDQYHSIQQNNMELVVDIKDEKRAIVIDPHEMKRAVINLIRNAIQHNQQGTEIYVAIINQYDGYGIVVADSGEELGENLISCMYEPFTKGEQSRNDNGHNGLGLAIVKKIIDEHGGELIFRQPYFGYTKAFIIKI